MTRRQLFRRRPLSLQAYIHRATVGLPKAERLDAAAELRTHLVERIDILQAEGHPADEAEFLAVQAMGDPAPTNRGLIGHAFTHRLGWLALGLVVIGGGGWYGYGYAQREWMPPREGVEYSGDLTLDDLNELNTDILAPRGKFQAVTVTYPRSTKSIIYALVKPGELNLYQKNLEKETSEIAKMNELTALPGSFRYQERWLFSNLHDTKNCPGYHNVFSSLRILSNRLTPTRLSSLPGIRQACGGVKMQFTTLSNPGQPKVGILAYTQRAELILYSKILTTKEPLPLSLNRWTILHELVLNPRTAGNGKPGLPGKAAGLYLAILPRDQPASPGESSGGKADAQGNPSLAELDGKPLSALPQLNKEQENFGRF